MPAIRAARRVVPLAIMAMGASAFWVSSPADAAQGPVGLGRADSFAVLAGSGITNTGPTTITGDVGTFPTPSETGFGSVTLNGANHAGDAVTKGAKDDLVTAYNDAFGRRPATPTPVELGGSRLLAGVYTGGTFGLTGTLTLDAQGVPSAEFIFQAASTLITAPNSRVLLINGADPCHVVWQVGSSATFDTGTRFVGDVLAQTSISALTGAVFQGRLLARDGAVTMDTDTITRAGCVAASSSGGTPTTIGATTSTTTRAPTVAAAPTSPRPGSAAAPTPTGGTPAVPAAPARPASTLTTTPGSPPSPGVPGSTLTTTPGTPPGAIPPTRPSPPFAATGADVVGLAGTALGLIAFGAIAWLWTRRATRFA